MTATVQSRAQLVSRLATEFASGAKNSASTFREYMDDVIASMFSCHGMLENTGINKTVILTNSTVELTAAAANATPWSAANTNNDTLTADPTVTGRVTCPSDAAAGKYLFGFTVLVVPDTVTAPFPASLPEQITLILGKNAGTFFGTPAKAFALPQPVVTLPLTAAPFSANIDGYCGALPSRFNATRLILMSAAGVVSDGTNKWSAIQVTNLGPSGAGSSTLFAAAKTTEGFALTAGLARAFAFDQNTAIAAGDTLRVQATKGGTANALDVVAVQGHHSMAGQQVCFQMSGWGFVDMVANDYVSMRGNIDGTFGTFTVPSGALWWKRWGGA